jgi:hypothetical protein
LLDLSHPVLYYTNLRTLPCFGNELAHNICNIRAPHPVLLTPQIVVGVSITMSSSQGGSRLQDHDEESVSDAEEYGVEEPAIASDKGNCLCQDVYIDSGNEKKVLYALCIGLNRNDEQPLFSFDRDPWSILPKNLLVRPQNNDYVNEIRRRADLFHINPVPRAKNWTRAQIMEWLERNPVRDAVDIEFLKGKVLRLEDVLRRTCMLNYVVTAAVEEEGTGKGLCLTFASSCAWLRIM